MIRTCAHTFTSCTFSELFDVVEAPQALTVNDLDLGGLLTEYFEVEAVAA